MLKVLFIAVSLSVVIATPSFGMSKENCGTDCKKCHSLSSKEASELMKPTGATVLSVKESPSRGLFELLVQKDNQKAVIFIDYGKKHLIQGMMVNLAKLEAVSSHKQELPQQKQPTFVDVKSIPVKNAVIMGNPRGSKKLYVFTDPDCPYCRKGHVELKKLAKIAPDVAIHVMLYPLPMHPGAYDKSRSVFESMSHDLLDKAFEGQEVPKPTKESSRKVIDENIKFANANNISGTPTMIMPNGKVEVGMRDAETLKRMLEGK
ncbi:MAG: DsbC family protein [Geobacteraceae bacterium]|nr:DsbC family protein [Geobacteraceae bacterium]